MRRWWPAVFFGLWFVMLVGITTTLVVACSGGRWRN
jgi:hypothetical protein